jgi:hypothetical protein
VSQSLYVVFLVLDLTIVALWLVFYFEHYEKISAVVGGIWGAVVAVLSFFKIKVKGGQSFSAFINLRPVKIIIITYTSLIFVSSIFFTLWEFPVHAVQINVEDGSLKEGTVVEMLWRTAASDSVININNGSWEFYTNRGSYFLSCQMQGFKPQTVSVDVDVFSLKTKSVFKDFEPLDGYLQLSYWPSGLTLSIYDRENTEVVKRSQLTGEKPLLFELLPGEYLVKSHAPGYIPDSSRFTVTVADTTKHQIKLLKNIEPVPVGTLKISSSPPEMQIFVDGQFTGKLTPNTIQKPPSQYRLELKKQIDDRYGYYLNTSIEVKASRETKFDTSLSPIQLCELIVIPREPGLPYYLDNLEHSLGIFDHPTRIYVFPGEHRLLKQKEGQTIFSRHFIITEREGNEELF